MKVLSWSAILLFLVNISTAQSTPRPKGPLVLISGAGNITVSGGSIGPISGASASSHDQTIEMAQQLLKHCPEVTLTLKSDPTPDYVLLLNREGAGMLDIGNAQIMLVRGSDKIVLWAVEKNTVAKAVKEGCKAVLADWKKSPAAGDWWQNAKNAKN